MRVPDGKNFRLFNAQILQITLDTASTYFIVYEHLWL
jgi:hypothetical protein